MVGYSIRPAVANDCNDIHLVHTETIINVTNDQYTAEQIAKWAQRQNLNQYMEPIKARCVYLVTTEKDDIVAFGHGQKINIEQYKIEALFVHPSHSKKGLGKKLLKHMEKVAAEGGSREILLRSSLNAVGFYEANGFVPREIEDHSRGCGSCVMKCRNMTKLLNC